MEKTNLNNFVIDKVVNFRICGKCLSCNEYYDLVKEDTTGICTSPHFCPHCGFDIRKYEHEEALKRQKEIECNEHCQLRYDVIEAHYCGVKLHPQEQMKSLGYELIDSIPQSIADCWWFTVDRFIEPLPKYLHKIKYTIGKP